MQMQYFYFNKVYIRFLILLFISILQQIIKHYVNDISDKNIISVVYFKNTSIISVVDLKNTN